MRRAVLVFCLVAVATVFAADPPGSPKSREALDLCHRARRATGAEAGALIDRSVAVAEEAVRDDDRDALAHFALFCSLGVRLRRAGLSLSAVGNLRRVRRQVDRTLELAPDFADALAGKGALLIDTPRLLGGDRAEGERLLRRALEVDPDYLGPRLNLARSLLERGARAEARSEAERALAIAERRHQPEDAAEARRLLDRIGQ